MILHKWNPAYAPVLKLGGVLDETDGRCIHQLVEFAAKRSPEAIAVSYQGQQYTYNQLNEMANKYVLCINLVRQPHTLSD